MRLPAIPDTGADRFDIDNRQYKEKLQPTGALHQIRKVAHGPWVRNIAPLRDVRHHEMVFDKPGDRFCFRRAHTEARTELARNALTCVRMIFFAALGNVVQED